MGDDCIFCGAAWIDGQLTHAVLCPLSHALADPDRKLALGMGFEVATSDWVDAAARAADVMLPGMLRDTLIAMLSLHHQWLDREKAAAVAASRTFTTAQVLEEVQASAKKGTAGT